MKALKSVMVLYMGLSLGACSALSPKTYIPEEASLRHIESLPYIGNKKPIIINGREVRQVCLHKATMRVNHLRKMGYEVRYVLGWAGDNLRVWDEFLNPETGRWHEEDPTYTGLLDFDGVEAGEYPNRRRILTFSPDACMDDVKLFENPEMIRDVIAVNWENMPDEFEESYSKRFPESYSEYMSSRRNRHTVNIDIGM